MQPTFQDLVFVILMREVGNPWKDIQARIKKGTDGRDVLARAKISEEIVNLVEFSVRLGDEGEGELAGEVFVDGFPEPLDIGELYVHPTDKTLCVVEVEMDDVEIEVEVEEEGEDDKKATV